jgi:hypothetical protein
MNEPAPSLRSSRSWHGFLRRYVAVTLALNLIWEFAQLPLYTLWNNGSLGALLYSPAHCTIGDAMIAVVALTVALLILGNSNWPKERYGTVAAASIGIGLLYTGYSEWMNVYIRKSWGYSELMPTVMGVGVSPLLQWLIIPAAAFFWLRDRRRARS